MTKLLLRVGLVFALSASGWANAIAAGLCPHPGCAMSAGVEAQHLSTGDAALHADHGLPEGPVQGGHAGHGGQESGVGNDAPLVSVHRATGCHESSCGHCVGAPRAPAKGASKAARSGERRDDGADAAPLMARRGVLPAVASYPALSPSQGSPPAPAGRRKHLILSTFLI